MLQDLAVSTFPHGREVAGPHSVHSIARPALLQLLRIAVFLLDAAVGIVVRHLTLPFKLRIAVAKP